jgi:anti-sigma28 factor (negative regulator of flagellin synthesis)
MNSKGERPRACAAQTSVVEVASAVARAHKVALIRQAIRQGRYKVDVPKLADILCRHL